jgi:hypothetical protein
MTFKIEGETESGAIEKQGGTRRAVVNFMQRWHAAQDTGIVVQFVRKLQKICTARHYFPARKKFRKIRPINVHRTNSKSQL